MKYLLGKTMDGAAVFAVKCEEAFNHRALGAATDEDLMALIADSALAAAQ